MMKNKVHTQDTQYSVGELMCGFVRRRVGDSVTSRDGKIHNHCAFPLAHSKIRELEKKSNIGGKASQVASVASVPRRLSRTGSGSAASRVSKTYSNRPAPAQLASHISRLEVHLKDRKGSVEDLVVSTEVDVKSEDDNWTSVSQRGPNSKAGTAFSCTSSLIREVEQLVQAEVNKVVKPLQKRLDNEILKNKLKQRTLDTIKEEQ